MKNEIENLNSGGLPRLAHALALALALHAAPLPSFPSVNDQFFRAYPRLTAPIRGKSRLIAPNRTQKFSGGSRACSRGCTLGTASNRPKLHQLAHTCAKKCGLFTEFRGSNPNKLSFSASLPQILNACLTPPYRFLTGPIALLTGTLPVPDLHFDQCSCGSLPVLPVQHPKGGSPAPMHSRNRRKANDGLDGSRNPISPGKARRAIWHFLAPFFYCLPLDPSQSESRYLKPEIFSPRLENIDIGAHFPHYRAQPMPRPTTLFWFRQRFP